MHENVLTQVQLEAEAAISTAFGRFIIRGYSKGDEKSVVLIRGAVTGRENVLVRIQSSCLFGESFYGTKCDCNWQLTTSLRQIGREGTGMLVYLFQEGRGIGIFEKIKIYQIEEQHKCDTVEAFKILGLEKSDLRTYDIVANIIRYEDIKSVRLLTNNDSKLEALVDFGIPAIREPLALKVSDFKKIVKIIGRKDARSLIEYLEAKEKKLHQGRVAEGARAFLDELSKGSKL